MKIIVAVREHHLLQSFGVLLKRELKWGLQKRNKEIILNARILRFS